MGKTKIDDAIQISLHSLIKSGIVKSINFDQVNTNNRLIATLEGKDSTYAEILLGEKSNQVINEEGGWKDNMNFRSFLVLLEKAQNGSNLRFVIYPYTSLPDVYDLPENSKIERLKASHHKSIINALDSYFR
jgi:hypothetical protein